MKYLVGIDLGTTNTVVASTRADDGTSPSGARAARSRTDAREVALFMIPQRVTAGEVEARALLPSCLYAPVEGETTGEDPWCHPPWTSGAFAKRRGAEVPGRGVASSKSWLAHGAVNWHAAILPWGAGSGEGDDVPRISPVDASARTLEHVRRAWDAAHPDAPLAEQEVVLTVPASFDEAARELTLEAASSVGLMPRLLEEPTAAFYDWMHHGRDRDALGFDHAARPPGADGAKLVLVCDVGGGTTDLSLIRIDRGEAGKMAASRVAVGRHVLLGGDNMDLALAHACEARLTPAASEKLDAARFAQLVAACRDAKEKLLGDAAPSEVRVVIAGSGAKLVGGTLATTLTREECERVVLDGFFPETPPDAEPVRARAALVGFGLPYERDVAITRHVASFLKRHAGDGGAAEGAARSKEGVAVDAILLNGGVFRASRIVKRLVDAIDAWGDHAAARPRSREPRRRGCARRGGVRARASRDRAARRRRLGARLLRRARGPGVGSPSEPSARLALCVVPRGAPEETMLVARAHPLALVVGRPTRFELWASDEARDEAGALVTIDEDRFTRLPPVVARFDAEGATREEVRVALEGELTAIGTLELACVALDDARRFRLAFALRGEATKSAPPPSRATREAPKIPADREAQAALRATRVFAKKSDATERDVKDLVRDLEKLLGERATWTTPTARAIFDAIIPGRGARRRSPDHERVFWLLAGFCLRPGFGDPNGRVARRARRAARARARGLPRSGARVAAVLDRLAAHRGGARRGAADDAARPHRPVADPVARAVEEEGDAAARRARDDRHGVDARARAGRAARRARRSARRAHVDGAEPRALGGNRAARGARPGVRERRSRRRAGRRRAMDRTDPARVVDVDERHERDRGERGRTARAPDR